MYNGTVKFFNESKGFGFVVDNSSKEEIFVHVSGLIDNIREGDQVHVRWQAAQTHVFDATGRAVRS